MVIKPYHINSCLCFVQISICIEGNEVYCYKGMQEKKLTPSCHGFYVHTILISESRLFQQL